MLKTKNFGRKSLNEIKQLLEEMELSLGMKIDEWEPLAKGAWSELRVLRVQDDDCGE